MTNRPHSTICELDEPTQTASVAWYFRALVHFIFFFSGAAALVYEISWARQIGLLFGHTVHAAAIVLASYFAGMALGYLLGARWSSRIAPLKGYAIAEFVVAGWALAIPFVLTFSESPTIAALLSHSSPALQTAIRGVFSFLLLLPATTALGITLPMIATFFSKRNRDQSLQIKNASQLSFAYGLNTAGALLGVFAATFYMLVHIGVRKSSYVAAGLSVVCAIVALLLSRITRADPGLESPTDNPNCNSSDDTNFGNPFQRGLLAIAAISGFGTLALQVLYTRMFSLVFHNSTYTFGVVVMVFLAALSCGAMLASLLQRWFSAEKLLGLATGLGGFLTATSVIVFVFATELNYFKHGESFYEYIVGASWLVTKVVAPPITFLGMMLPLAWTIAGKTERAGQVVGKLTAINTIAAAVGAVVASFFLLTWLGLWPSVVAISLLFFVTAFAVLWTNQQRISSIGFALGIAVSIVFALASPIEPVSDPSKPTETIVKRWNSSYGWIDVIRNEKTKALKIRQNLHYRFGATGKSPREFRQAHIPLLLHDDPKDILFMGLGTGLTAGGAVPYPNVERIVAVELIPEVVQAIRMLSEFNYDLIDHPKVDVHVDDARHYLLAHDRKFDVIVSDLFVPWESESGYLYTVEHYRIALQRLADDGIFCQWLPLYQLGEGEFQSIADSFDSIFPYTTVWYSRLNSTRPVIALIGTRSPIIANETEVNNRLIALRKNLTLSSHTLDDSKELFELYAGDWIQRSTENLNTDEHPRVEFLTPISNRDRKLISGRILSRYFREVLTQLPKTITRE